MWGNRNKVVHGSVSSPLSVVTSFVGSYLDSFGLASVESAVVQSILVLRWCTGALGGLKLNSDAAFDGEKNVGGLGGVVQNGLRRPVLMFMKPVLGCLDFEVGEALALLFGFKCAVSFGLIPEELVSDSRNVVELVSSPKRSLALGEIFSSEVVLLGKRFSFRR